MENILVNNHIFMFKIENGQIYLLVKKEDKKVLIPKYKYDGKSTLEKNIKLMLKGDIELSNVNLNQCHIFSNNNIIDIIFVAYIKTDKLKEGYKFLSLEEIDNKLICKEVIDYLKENLVKIDVMKFLMSEYFSLRELQDIYEKLFNITIDRRNFRKRLINLKVLVETENYKKKNSNGRPNKLYKFNEIKNINLI